MIINPLRIGKELTPGYTRYSNERSHYAYRLS
jgi:hypothetical protein